METYCTKPRGLDRSGSSASNAPHPTSLRGALPLAVALLGLGLSGCSIIFPPGNGESCVSLEEVCPNLECEAGFVVNEDGCALCECAEVDPEPEPQGCVSDSDCRAGEMCVFGAIEPGPRDAGPAPTEPAEDGGSAPGAPPPAQDAGSPDPMPPPLCDPDDPDADSFCSDSDRPEEEEPCEPDAEGNCGGGEDRPLPDAPGFVPGEGTCVPVGCPAIGVACPNGFHVEFDFSNDPCGDPRCVPDDEPPPGECVVDADCRDGLKCEILNECGSLCEPGSNEPCPDVCVVIGRCVDPDPFPGCLADADCGPGFLCELTEVCACEGQADPIPPGEGEGARPAPCLQECFDVGQCVWNPENDTCYGDGDCGAGQRCEYFDGCLIPPDCPNCLVACQGVCVDDEPAPVVCQSDGDCGADEICDLINYCELPPGCDEGESCPPVCYGRCVPPQPATADACLEQADCAEGFRCANEVDFCYCPDGETCDVCYWQCVPDDGTP